MLMNPKVREKIWIVRRRRLRTTKKLPLNQTDVFIRLFRELVATLQTGNIRYGFEHMDRFFQKREDIGGKHLNPVFIQHECRDLTVIETIFPQFDHFFCKFFLRATTERRIFAVAAEEVIEKSEDLFPHGKIKRIIINPRRESFEHGPGKRQFGEAKTGKPL